MYFFVMSSVFSKIIKRELPAYILYEDDLIIAILNINPNNLGHTLLIPKVEIPDFVDLGNDLRNHIFKIAQNLSKSIYKVTECKRVGMAIHGMGIPEHFHLHIIPMFDSNDLNLGKNKNYSPEKMQIITAKIKDDLTIN
jgi:histidine triad (HIT) family protein